MVARSGDNRIKLVRIPLCWIAMCDNVGCHAYVLRRGKSPLRFLAFASSVPCIRFDHVIDRALRTKQLPVSETRIVLTDDAIVILNLNDKVAVLLSPVQNKKTRPHRLSHPPRRPRLFSRRRSMPERAICSARGTVSLENKFSEGAVESLTDEPSGCTIKRSHPFPLLGLQEISAKTSKFASSQRLERSKHNIRLLYSGVNNTSWSASKKVYKWANDEARPIAHAR